VIGSGGAGRAAAVGLQRAGALTVLVNRTVETGLRVAEALRVPFEPLADFDPGRWDIVVNATSLGHGADDELPFDPAALAPGAAVIDLVYGERPTVLLERVLAQGATGVRDLVAVPDLVAVDGREVLLFQAVDQFRLMTGRELPVDLARQLLDLPASRRAA
jgi:shikimate 5-dehydrogenase